MIPRYAALALMLPLAGFPLSAQTDAVHDTVVHFTRGTMTIEGTLVLPAGKGPWPAAVIIAGSGPTVAVRQTRIAQLARHDEYGHYDPGGFRERCRRRRPSPRRAIGHPARRAGRSQRGRHAGDAGRAG